LRVQGLLRRNQVTIKERRNRSLRRRERRGAYRSGHHNGGAPETATEVSGKRPPIEPNETVMALVDGRLDERLDAETTKSSFAILLSGFAILVAAVAGITIFAVAGDDDGGETAVAPAAHDHAAAVAAESAAADVSAAAGKGIDFEPYKRPDPTLPAVPAGAVKKFKVDVYEHVTKVSDDLAPTRVWSYGVNGKLNRGTGVSEPMVVNEGDRVEIELVNGGSEAMDVRMPHSIDFHSSEIAPNEAFITIQPGETHEFAFNADHPGVYMYHCATDPVLHHTGAGMVGMMVVKDANLPPVDRELWMTQQEFYLGAPGEDADLAKMEAKQPDAITFNGYAAQYKDHPIEVGAPGERIRMYVLNAGPSVWSAFHVIGTVFDKAVSDNGVARDVQTVNLAPSQGGYVEFTLDEEGTYPFVTHAFGDMVKGAVGVLATKGADGAQMEH
jgi:nitrite reductase (NO-forming)